MRRWKAVSRHPGVSGSAWDIVEESRPRGLQVAELIRDAKDATLMAAAQELLEACRAIVDAYDISELSPQGATAYELAHEAIAKATAVPSCQWCGRPLGEDLHFYRGERAHPSCIVTNEGLEDAQ